MGKIIETIKKYRRRRRLRIIVESILKTDPKVLCEYNLFDGLYEYYLHLYLDFPLPKEDEKKD